MTRQIYAGPVAIGGGALVSIQSMLNTRTTDVEGSLRQIRQLAAAGCEIARLAIPDMDATHAFREICAESPLPLVADIHFDYRLAIAAAEAGAKTILIELPKFASTPATSAARSASALWSMSARRSTFRSVSA